MLIQIQGHVDMSVKDKKQALADLDCLRDKLRDTLKEKLEIENNFNTIQQHEMSRLNNLEQKFEAIS